MNEVAYECGGYWRLVGDKHTSWAANHQDHRVQDHGTMLGEKRQTSRVDGNQCNIPDDIEGCESRNLMIGVH
jgi:hypothetical protein